MSTSHYEFLEHTADVIIRGYGDRLDDAFAAAGDGLFHLITNGGEIVGDSDWSWELTSEDYEGLLVNFLTELIVRFDAELEVMSDLKVKLYGSTRLVATGRTVAYDESRHGCGTPAKGVSYHMIEIQKEGSNSRAYVQVLVDI